MPPLQGEKISGYADDRGDGSLHWGTCQVHLSGENSQKFPISAKTRMPIEGILQEMNRDLGSDFTVFVYIHGFCNSFDSAIRTAAQLDQNLGLKIAVIAYCWPSLNSFWYTGDENNVDWTVPHFEEFLLTLSQKIQPKKIHILAQSMGNRVLCYGLERIALQGTHTLPLGQIIFAAPDVDAGVFCNRIFPKIRGKAERFTLYTSYTDRALLLSSQIHQYPRLGEIKERPVVLAGMDTLDATDLKMTFLGHFYYVRHHAMTQEIQELLCFNRDPNTRKGELFKEFLDNGMVYWKILNTRTNSSGGDTYRERAKIYYATDRALR